MIFPAPANAQNKDGGGDDPIDLIIFVVYVRVVYDMRVCLGVIAQAANPNMHVRVILVVIVVVVVVVYRHISS